MRSANAYLRDVAGRGVAEFELTPLPDRRGRALIDGKELILPAQLWRLLQTLASSEFGVSDDGFVGWKPIAEVADRISLKSGRRVTAHSVSHNIWRLRCALERAGLNKFVVQTDRTRGARLALLQRSARDSQTA